MAGIGLVSVRDCGEACWLLDVMMTSQKQTSVAYYRQPSPAESEILRRMHDLTGGGGEDTAAPSQTPKPMDGIA
jgi:hypothetical protein